MSPIKDAPGTKVRKKCFSLSKQKHNIYINFSWLQIATTTTALNELCLCFFFKCVVACITDRNVRLMFCLPVKVVACYADKDAVVTQVCKINREAVTLLMTQHGVYEATPKPKVLLVFSHDTLSLDTRLSHFHP